MGIVFQQAYNLDALPDTAGGRLQNRMPRHWNSAGIVKQAFQVAGVQQPLHHGLSQIRQHEHPS